MSLPLLQTGLDILLKIPGNNLAPVVKKYLPAKELAAEAANRAPDVALPENIAQIRDQILAKYETHEMGNLLSKYHVDRDTQMTTLSHLGKDVLLSVMAQGVLPAELAEALEVSYDTFHEFVRITCTVEEIKHSEKLAADNLVAKGLKKLNDAKDKEDLAIAKALADMYLKLAKAMSGKYSEQRPTTAVQVNNYGETPGHIDSAAVPYLQIILPDPDNMPELPEHRFTADRRDETFKPDGIVDGEFTLYGDIDE